MSEFFFFILFLLIIFIWISPKEERATIVGVKQLVFNIFWFFFIFLLLNILFLVNLFDFYQIFFSSYTGYCGFFSIKDVVGLFFGLIPKNIITNQAVTHVFLQQQVYSLVLSVIYADFGNFISVELVISFFIACFSTITIFYILLLARPVTLVYTTYLYLGLLLIISLIFIFTTSLFCMFIMFECLLLVSLGLLRLTSKSERIGEAISEMFIWTLFGSFFLLLGFFILYFDAIGSIDSYNSFILLRQNSISNLVCFFFIIGFGVKVPVWPFISWLLKAHVEASVEFSILLSGFIVKLGILGLWRILDAFSSTWAYIFILSMSCLAIFDATIRLFTQTDLKRIVALTTVIEMNWLNLCYLFGDIHLIFLAHFLIIAHCFTTSSEFLLVEFISKRYASRDFWQITGLWYNTPSLWYLSFIVILITIGFPGTSIFFAKFLFFSVILSYSLWLFLYFILIFFLVLPLFFMRLWVPVWFGLPTKRDKSYLILDLTARELFLLSFTAGMGLLLGIYPTFFFSIF